MAKNSDRRKTVKVPRKRKGYVDHTVSVKKTPSSAGLENMPLSKVETGPKTATVWRWSEWRNEEAYRRREASEASMYSTEYNDLCDIEGFGGYSFVAQEDVLVGSQEHKMAVNTAEIVRKRRGGTKAALPSKVGVLETATVWRFSEWENEEAYRRREASTCDVYSTEYNDLADIPGFGGYSFVAQEDVLVDSYEHRSAVSNAEIERKRWAREPALG